MAYIEKIDELGGMVARDRARATRSARSPTPPIATSSRSTAARRSMVGVNKYVMTEERPIDFLKIDAAVEHEQIERVGRFKAARDAARSSGGSSSWPRRAASSAT